MTADYMSLLFVALGYYLLAGLGVGLAYHRCLSHRSLQLRKPLERVLISVALPAGTPIQWVGTHRFHHKCADETDDPHSPIWKGFWYSHVGWYIGTSAAWICVVYSLAGPIRTLYDGWNRPRTNQQYNHLARDVAADRYYRFVSKPLPFLAACVLHVALSYGLVYVGWGWVGVGVLWAVSVAVYNLGDSIDSFAHLFGRRPFNSTHRARNNFVLGYLTLGEGWHANHHEFPESARQGLLPRQFDWIWQVIVLLQLAGLAYMVKVPTENRIRRRLAE